MTLQRMEHKGAVPSTGLSTTLSASATSFTVLDGTGFPDGTVGPFVIGVDLGTASEEKILCSSRSTNTFTVATSGRGWDGTVVTTHSTGSTNVEHVLAAVEVDDDNDHIYTTTRDDHTQYARTDGTRAVTGPQTFSGGLTVSGGSISASGVDATVNNLSADGTLSVTGAATLSSTLGVVGLVTASGEVNAEAFKATGLTGANAHSTRWVGGVSGAAPTSGTFAAGDVVVDQTGAIWECTTAGSPGTWVLVGAQAATAAPSDSNPGAVGDQGTGTTWARADHVHGREERQITIAASAPASPNTGDMWVNSSTYVVEIWDGTAWANLGVPSGVADGSSGTVIGTSLTLVGWNVPTLAGGLTWLNDAFVVPVAGFYHVSASVLSTVAGTAGDQIVEIYKNGTATSLVGQSAAGASGFYGASVSGLLQCAANDSISVYAQFPASGNAFGGGFFSTHFVSKA